MVPRRIDLYRLELRPTQTGLIDVALASARIDGNGHQRPADIHGLNVSRMCPATDHEKMVKDGHWRSAKSAGTGTLDLIRSADETLWIRLLIRRLWVRVPPPEPGQRPYSVLAPIARTALVPRDVSSSKGIGGGAHRDALGASASHPPAASRRAPPEASGPPRSRSAVRRRHDSPGSPRTLRSGRLARGREYQDVEQLGAGSGAEVVQTLP
jgi:hypothetical protein